MRDFFDFLLINFWVINAENLVIPEGHRIFLAILDKHNVSFMKWAIRKKELRKHS